MPWFYVKEVDNGAVFNYSIKNHLVQVVDPYHVQELRRDPSRFRQLSTEEEAQILRRASSSQLKAKAEPEVNPAQPIKPVQPVQPKIEVKAETLVKPVETIKNEIAVEKRKVKKIKGTE